MWIARPGYQPGKQVSKSTRPFASVTCVPRKQLWFGASASPPLQNPGDGVTPEYTPFAIVCQISTVAPTTGVHVVWLMILRARRIGSPGNPSLTSLRAGAVAVHGPPVVAHTTSGHVVTPLANG